MYWERRRKQLRSSSLPNGVIAYESETVNFFSILIYSNWNAAKSIYTGRHKNQIISFFCGQQIIGKGIKQTEHRFYKSLHISATFALLLAKK